jgi:hypothetical protein
VALSRLRDDFLKRLENDAHELSACRPRLSESNSATAVTRIWEIAHALAGVGGIYGFIGITRDSAALCEAAERKLAGRASRIDVERALDRLISRIESIFR